MTSKPATEQEIERLIKASEDLMNLGISFSKNIQVALDDFRQTVQLITKSHYLEAAAAEILTEAFNKFRDKLTSNLECIDKIYTEGGQWYSFYLGQAIGKGTVPPSSQSPRVPKVRTKAHL